MRHTERGKKEKQQGDLERVTEEGERKKERE